MTVLSFVESSEYRKQLARQLAQKLLADVGVDGLLTAGGVTADELVALLADEINGLVQQAVRDAVAGAEALGFPAIAAAAAQATMQAALDRVFRDAKLQLEGRLAALAATIDRMIAATSEQAVTASLGSAATQEALLAPITSVLTATAAGAVAAVEADIRAEAVAMQHEQASQNGGGPPLFEWQTLQDDRVCGQGDIFEVSCDARHGKTLTYGEWGAFGLPGDPNGPTICAIFAKVGSYCRCQLIPAGSAASTPTPINIADAAKAGRDRALKEAA